MELWARPPVLSHGHKKTPHDLWRFDSALLALVPLRRRLVTLEGILRLGKIALNAVHLDIILSEVRLDPKSGKLLSRMVGLAGLFFLLGVGEISGQFILQLQNTNDFAALRCMAVKIAELRSEPQDGWVGACLHFHHLDNSGHFGRSWLP